MPRYTTEQIDRAWALLGMREEAQIVKWDLARRLLAVQPPGIDASALRDIEAERRVARTILMLMGTDIDDPGPDTVQRTASELGAARATAKRQRTAGAARTRRQSARRKSPGESSGQG